MQVQLGGQRYSVQHADGPTLQRALRSLLARLVLANVEYLRSHPGTPPIYSAGVRYQEEPPGEEHWQTIPEVLAARSGDCEDLASWRAAELRVAGERARAEAHGRILPGRVLYHVLVRRGDGRLEDPSRRLGMR